jgi:endonuclease YncB( thermonuclease family)
MRISVLACTLLLLCASAHAQRARSVGDLISGHASTVVGGDAFRIGHDRIHIWGIDAPEWWRWCITSGRKWTPWRGSQAALKRCLGGTTVTCRMQKIERGLVRQRFVAECWRDDTKEDVGACMVGSGWATDYPGYSGGHYAPLEEEAKASLRGFWQCDGEPPTQRWCRWGIGVPCERPIYKPRGPGQA